MFYQASALTLCTLLLAASAIRKLSLFSPPVVTGVVWSIVFIAGLAFSDKFYPLTDQAFFAWLIWFSITGIGSFFLAPGGCQRSYYNSVRTLNFDYSFLMLLLILWLGYRIWVVGSTGPEHFFLNLRLSSNQIEGFEPLGLVGRFYPLVFALFIFEHIFANEKNRRRRVLCWVWMLAYAVATMGKFAVLTPIFTYCAIRGIQGRFKLRTIVAMGSCAFFLMLLVHFVRRGSEDGATFLDMLAIYIYSPLVALGHLEQSVAEQFLPHIFRLAYAVGSALNLTDPPVAVILDYVETPISTNVYTAMQPFMQDGGLLGVAFGAAVYMVTFSFLYRRSLSGHDLSLALYAALSVILVAQFIGDLFVTLLSLNIQLFVFTALIFFLSRRVERVR